MSRPVLGPVRPDRAGDGPAQLGHCVIPMFKAFILILLVSTTACADGLDSLNDDALMNELASRGLDTLLQRAFDDDQIPAAERQGRLTLLALSRLSDPNSHLSLAQRQKLINDIAIQRTAARHAAAVR